MRPRQSSNRRRFLEWLAASPLLAATSGGVLAQSYDVLRGAGILTGDVITSPAQALNVFDFEAAAKEALKAAPTHFGYLASGVDGDETLKANRDAFARYTVRVRRLIDARQVDTA
jgi:hypothetical protein